MTPDEETKAAALIEDMGAAAADWTDEEFAGRIVGLLIMDKGLVNAWQRTIEMSIRIFRVAERIRAERK